MEQEVKKIKRFKVGDWLLIAFVFGLIFSCGLIIASEIAWDAIWNNVVSRDQTLTREIVESFFRAALFEETFKFLGFFIAYKVKKINHQAIAMYACAIIGLMYGIVENIFRFNPISFVVAFSIPMHVLWQLNSGRHFQAFTEAKEEGKKIKAFKEFFLALPFVFLFHGIWDAVLSVGIHFMEDPNYGYIAPICFIFIIAIGIAYIIFTIIKTVKTTNKYRRDIREEDSKNHHDN